MLERFAAASSLLALCLMAGAEPGRGQGYLAAHGPTPLRFQTRPEPGAARVPLPPLPQPAVRLELPPVPAPPTVPAATADPPTAAPAAPDVTGPPTLPPGELVTPELFLKFFSRKPTNGVSTTVIAPIGFQPPVPVAVPPPPSSKATYKSEP